MTHWKTNRRINRQKVYLKIFIVVLIRVLLQLYSTRWEFSQDVLRILAWPLWWLNLFQVHLSISPCKGVWSGNLLRRQPINQGELSLVRGAGRNRQMCGQAVYSHCQSIHYIPHLCFVQTPNQRNTRWYGPLRGPTSRGLWPSSFFFPFRQTKGPFRPSCPFWCTVVTLITLSSKLWKIKRNTCVLCRHTQ